MGWAGCTVIDIPYRMPLKDQEEQGVIFRALGSGVRHPLSDFDKKQSGYSVDGFPGGSDGNVSAYNVGDPGSIPESGRSPGEGNGNPLQQSSLKNPMDRGAWQVTVQRVAKSQTRLSN